MAFKKDLKQLSLEPMKSIAQNHGPEPTALALLGNLLETPEALQRPRKLCRDHEAICSTGILLGSLRLALHSNVFVLPQGSHPRGQHIALLRSLASGAWLASLENTPQVLLK